MAVVAAADETRPRTGGRGGPAATAAAAVATRRLSSTLSFYIGRQVMLGVGIVAFGLAALAYVIDAVEILREARDREGVGLGLILMMAGLHLPHLLQQLLPFSVLFGAMLSFMRLNRTQELVAARALGISVWQFLTPALAFALGLGLVAVGVLNPIAAAMTERFERLDQLYMSDGVSLVSVSSGGLWLRQQRGGDEELIIHARHVAATDPAELRGVTVLVYAEEVRFAGRVDAPVAYLEDGRWRLEDPLVAWPDGRIERRAEYLIPTDLTARRMMDSFGPPETVSFWDLPEFIALLEAVGLPTTAHRLHLHALLAMPLLFCAMLLIGTTFSLRLVRRGGTGLLVGAGLATAFAFFMFSDIVQAIGLSGQIPAALAAGTPAGVAILLGLATLLHLEDG